MPKHNFKILDFPDCYCTINHRVMLVSSLLSENDKLNNMMKEHEDKKKKKKGTNAQSKYYTHAYFLT